MISEYTLADYVMNGCVYMCVIVAYWTQWWLFCFCLAWLQWSCSERCIRTSHDTIRWMTRYNLRNELCVFHLTVPVNTWMGDRLSAGWTFRCTTSYLGQLSLSSLQIGKSSTGLCWG